ncbi:methylated-DNA--[protein]-cysteine S-methyltransferase [Sphingomonas mollis]|uniref:Methylated-DNA--protein-cysteine methyltransferase n=1 Tax=Sphingomonas mollis TaxID=2795726 RepID=A0ABS0XNT3_9SPHN|nr:methylated-DNA--[protein]-cysteine S-methyltransferase [Sphingomonas sp. BT553]MBJ6121702.1 methylated-DNA--[protein]-cysteine S-methyltransferase [Sphingomonas sp. BT553]
MSSPVGELTLVSRAGQLVAVLWPDDDPRRVVLPPMTEDLADPVLIEASRQLAEYFDGHRRSFALPLAFAGTAFQRSVWVVLLTIHYGETRSYAAIAAMIGRPSACRAVGAANGRNPLSIVAPCHRVIGTSGRLTGFAGGLAAKRRLLELEAPADRLL